MKPPGTRENKPGRSRETSRRIHLNVGTPGRMSSGGLARDLAVHTNSLSSSVTNALSPRSEKKSQDWNARAVKYGEQLGWGPEDSEGPIRL